MAPLTLLAAQKLAALLTAGDALQDQIAAISSALNITVPPIPSAQVLLSAATPAMGDNNLQFAYPRVCIYPGSLKNSLIEKFRSFSGQVDLVAEIWASGDLLTDVDQWIHFYVQGIGSVLQNNRGDWGDGMFFAGAYDVQFQAPKAGWIGLSGIGKAHHEFDRERELGRRCEQLYFVKCKQVLRRIRSGIRASRGNHGPNRFPAVDYRRSKDWNWQDGTIRRERGASWEVRERFSADDSRFR